MNIEDKKQATKFEGKPDKGDKFKKDKYRGGKRGQKDKKDKIPSYKNSPEVFEKYKNIVAASTAVNGFTRAIGRDPLPLELANNPGTNLCKTSVAGIASAALLPIWTAPTSASNAINIAAKKIAADMRSLNTGSKVYEACDLLLYHLAGAEVASMIEWARAVLGVILSYDVFNSYLPRTLVTAMGWNYDDLVADPYSFEAQLNVCIRKMAAWNFLKDFEFINKAKQVYTPILMESNDSTKTQFYVYRPFTTARLNYSSDRSKAILEYYRRNSSGGGFLTSMTRDRFILILNQMIDAFSDWTWTSTISGDILKFKSDQILQWTEVSIKEVTQFHHDEDMLEQFMNMPIFNASKYLVGTKHGYIAEAITPGGVATNNLVLYGGDDNPFTFEPASYSALLDKRMLRTYRPSLTDAQVMDLTVYDVSGTVTGFTGYPNIVTSLYPLTAVLSPSSAGLYVCVGVDVFYGDTDNGTFGVTSEPWTDYGYSKGEPSEAPYFSTAHFNARWAAICGNFHYLPTQFTAIADYQGSTTVGAFELIVHSDIEQFAMYDQDELKNIAFARNAIYFGL